MSAAGGGGLVLRPYQEEAIAELRKVIHRRPVYVAPTGSGKTVVAAAIVRLALERGKRCLFVAPSREVVFQSAEKMGRAGVFMAEESDLHSPVIVASAQTLDSRIRNDKPTPAADLLIIDEAHHACAESWIRIVEHYAEAYLFGMTATPCRLDGKGLGEVFGALVETTTVADLIEAGHLANFRWFAAAASPDLTGLRKQGGDYLPGELGERMTALDGNVVEHYRKHLDGKTALVFACTVAHSQGLAERFTAAGIPAAHVDAETPKEERESTFAALREGRVKVVTNVRIVYEGFDAPSLDGVILARPTASLGLARQMVGRALRPPGTAVILDHARIYEKHGLPDEPIEWTLDPERKAERPAEAPTKTCPEKDGGCGAVIALGCMTCPECGYEFPRRDRTAESAGELEEVHRDFSPNEPREVLMNLLRTAHVRNYQIGWASHRYHKRFNAWPRMPRLKGLIEHEEGEFCRFCDSVRERIERNRQWQPT